MVNLHLLTQHIMPSYTHKMANVTADSVTSFHPLYRKTINLFLKLQSAVSDNPQKSTVVKNQAMLTYVYRPTYCFCLFIAATVFLGE